LDLTATVSTKLFFDQRKEHPLKVKNLTKVNDFLRTVEKLAHKYEGKLSHIDLYDRSDPHLVYEEGNPNFRLYKVSPNGTFINYHDEQNHFWKTTPINEDTVEKVLSMQNNKYSTSQGQLSTPERFVLVPLQKAILENRFLEVVARRAKVNKSYVVFKEHPCSSEKETLEEIVASVKNKSDYTIFAPKDVSIDALIEECHSVWTLNSGVGFTALLRGKTVVTFKGTDYSVFDNKAPSQRDLYQFITWYYDVFSIDIKADNFESRLDQRFDAVFNKGHTIKELYTWK
tara:strand:- start:104 stop:961 length:858 start_codon:yes stop_codon:yes gene_type:complete